PYKSKGFSGVIAADEIPKLIPHAKKYMSWVMNKDPSNKPGSHWVAVLIDGRPKGEGVIEYYDSLAEKPDKRFFKDIKPLVEKISPDVYLKYKYNKIKEQ